MKSSPSSEQLWAVVSDTKPAMCEALERVFGTSFELFSSDSDDADLVEIACQIGQRRLAKADAKGLCLRAAEAG